MMKSLLLSLVPTPFCAFWAAGSEAEAVIKVLAAKVILPVSFAVNLTEKGVVTAASVHGLRSVTRKVDTTSNETRQRLNMGVIEVR